MSKMNLRIASFLLSIVLFVAGVQLTFSQSGFNFPDGVKKDRLRFELINNLVIIPVEVNGTELSFILDTGVSSSILFGVADEETVELNNAKAIRIRGLGVGESIEALRSMNNRVKVGDAVDNDHTIYVIFEESLNLSPRMGLPIHGIIGYDFFKNFIVKIDYISKIIRFYDPNTYKRKVCRSCEVFDLTFFEKKPYIDVIVSSEKKTEKATLLIDSGSSDAIWLFDESGFISDSPVNYFVDFLGMGLSGNIHGKRTRLNNLSIGRFSMDDVNVAFPEELALEGITFYKERKGSLGGDVLKRYNVTVDYPSKEIILRKNSRFKDPFYYNMSGLTIIHDGLEVVKDDKEILDDLLNINRDNDTSSSIRISTQKILSVFLAPKFVVAEVRPNSPADIAGIKKGDHVISINNKLSYRYKLHELVNLFSSKAGKIITMVVERNGAQAKIKFTLKKVI